MGRYEPEHLDNAKALTAAFEPFLEKARSLIADSQRDDRFNAEDSHGCLDEVDGFVRSIIDNMMSAHRSADDGIDSASYWKGAYERMAARNADLARRVAELEEARTSTEFLAAAE